MGTKLWEVLVATRTCGAGCSRGPATGGRQQDSLSKPLALHSKEAGRCSKVHAKEYGGARSSQPVLTHEGISSRASTGPGSSPCPGHSWLEDLSKFKMQTGRLSGRRWLPRPCPPRYLPSSGCQGSLYPGHHTTDTQLGTQVVYPPQGEVGEVCGGGPCWWAQPGHQTPTSSTSLRAHLTGLAQVCGPVFPHRTFCYLQCTKGQ